MSEIKNNVEVLKFEADNIPKPIESRETNDSKYVSYGYDNLYPNFLLKLYNESPSHSAIINGKTTYIIGDGLKSKDGAELSFKVNASDSIKELLDKIIKDYIIFNYFAVEVVYNIFGDPIEYHHVPAHLIRCNKTKTKFWYNEDWYINQGRKSISYDRFNGKSTDGKSRIFFYDGYFPSVNNVYPQPEYNGSIKSITTDIAIRDFNLNNIKNHFSVSSIITFFQGANVGDEVKKQIVRQVKESYTGEFGKKIIVDFQNQDGKSAEVKNLTPNDWSEAYTVLRNNVADEIYRGHQVTSPMLFGVKTEGQLGGASELETAYEIFKNTYIRNKRDELETAINMLFKGNSNVTSKVEFTDKPLFNTSLSDTMKEKVMTINEIRKEAGLPEIPNGNRLINDVAQAPVVEVEQSEEEVKKKSKKLSESDYELVKDMGINSDEYEFLGDADEDEKMEFGKVEDVAKYVIENDIKNLSLNELNELIKKEGIKVDVNELKDILNRLSKSGVIKVDIDGDGKVNIQPNKVADVPDTDAITVMYKYELRPGIAGPDLLPTSRSFCTKMIQNNRLYTRAEIQDMAAIFGYDTFKYAGGFYHNPNTGETTPWCRHTWKGYKVKRKKN